MQLGSLRSAAPLLGRRFTSSLTSCEAKWKKDAQRSTPPPHLFADWSTDGAPVIHIPLSSATTESRIVLDLSPTDADRLISYQFLRLPSHAQGHLPTTVSLSALSSVEMPHFEQHLLSLAQDKLSAATFHSSSPVPEPDSDLPKDDGQKYSPQRLQQLKEILVEDVSKLFVRPMRYNIYCEGMVFENSFSNRRTVGLTRYATMVSGLRIYGHVCYAYVKVDILQATVEPDMGMIKLRWRLRRMPTLKTLFYVFKNRSFGLKADKASPVEHEKWTDGVSYFFVNSEGRVWKHVMDRMDMDSEQLRRRPGPLAALVIVIGGLGSLSSDRASEAAVDLWMTAQTDKPAIPHPRPEHHPDDRAAVRQLPAEWFTSKC